MVYIAYEIIDNDFNPIACFESKEKAEDYKNKSKLTLNIESVPFITNKDVINDITYIKFWYKNKESYGYSLHHTNSFETQNINNINDCNIFNNTFNITMTIDENEITETIQKLRKYVPNIICGLNLSWLKYRDEIGIYADMTYMKINFDDVLKIIDKI